MRKATIINLTRAPSSVLLMTTVVVAMMMMMTTTIPFKSMVHSFSVYPTNTARRPAFPSTSTSSSTSTLTSTLSLLWAKKKSSKSSSSTKASSSQQVQVKLLKHVAGTGQAGDVVLVNPSYFNNKLRPQQAAKIVTDEEVEAQISETISKQRSERQKALAWQEFLDTSSSPYVLRLKDNKTGPDGRKLFGGIGMKKLYQELVHDLETKYSKEESLDVDFVQNSKQVKIGQVIDDESDEILQDGDHIKHVGTFQMNVVLLSPNHQTTTRRKKKGRPKPINSIPTSSQDDDEEEEIVATVKVLVEGGQ